MDSSQDFTPMPREELVWMVKYAKGFDCLANAMPIISLLENRYRGVYAPEDWTLIDSIKNYYKSNAEKEMEERLRVYYDRAFRKVMGLPELGVVDDEQIIAAIKQTEPYINVHSSWCGIYIILVSMCNWPESFDGFEYRVKRLEELGLKLPEKKCFTYQGLQKGWDSDWPIKYESWLQKQDGSNTFNKHKTLAGIFLNNLCRIQKENV
jgi:hypothetical protein